MNPWQSGDRIRQCDRTFSLPIVDAQYDILGIVAELAAKQTKAAHVFSVRLDSDPKRKEAAPGQFKLRQLHLGQSRLICDVSEDREQVGFIPARLETFVLDAEFSRGLLLECIECDVSQDGEIVSSIALAETGFIFTKGDIQHSMERILDLPTGAGGPEGFSCLSGSVADGMTIFSRMVIADIAF